MEDIRKKLKENRIEYIKSNITTVEGGSANYYEPYKFISAEIIDAMTEEDLQDIECMDIVTQCFIIDDKNKELIPFLANYDYLDNRLFWNEEKQRFIMFHEYDTFEDCGNNTYIKFVERLIDIHGKEFVLEKFGDAIREKVPNYALTLDSLDLTTEKGMDFLVDYYPRGFACRHIPIERVLKSLEGYDSYSTCREYGATPDEIVELFYKQGIEITDETYEICGSYEWLSKIELAMAEIRVCLKKGLPLPEKAIQESLNYGNEEELAYLCIESGYDIPDEARERLSEEKIKRTQEEVELARLQEEDRKLDEALKLTEQLNQQQKDQDTDKSKME